jgi:hypothetical protein
MERIHALDLEKEQCISIHCAMHKILVIQNDLFAQYYTMDGCNVPQCRYLTKRILNPGLQGWQSPRSHSDKP